MHTTGASGTIAASHHGVLEILRVVVRERRDLLGEQRHLAAGPRLEAFEPLLHIGEESGF